MTISKHQSINAGEFRHAVTVQRGFPTSDGAGGQRIDWQDQAVIFCSVKDVGGSEPYSDKAHGRIRTAQTFQIVTWYRDDILQTDRLLFEGLILNIRETDNHNLNRKFLSIRAEAGVEQ